MKEIGAIIKDLWLRLTDDRADAIEVRIKHPEIISLLHHIDAQAAEIERMRGALAGLVGTDDRVELDEIRATLRLIVSDDDRDKAALLAAIDVLKELK